MSWRDRLFGKQPPKPVVTSDPEPATRWESLTGAQRRVGSATDELLGALRGRAATVRVCATCRKPVPTGNVCPDGHVVG